jgi:hypothetical protein
MTALEELQLALARSTLAHQERMQAELLRRATAEADTAELVRENVRRTIAQQWGAAALEPRN